MIIEIFILTLVLAFFIIYGRVLHLRSSLPPGPFPLPFVGNLLQFNPLKAQEICLKWSRAYGPIFTVWFVHDPAIVITDYELMKDALVKHGDQLSGRSRSLSFEVFTGGNYGILFSSGDTWREQRRFSLQVLRNFGLGRNIMEQKILTEANKLSQSIIQDLGSKKQGILNLVMPIRYCVCNIISSTLFGRTFEQGDQGFQTMKNIFDESCKKLGGLRILMVNSFPWLRHVPLFGHFGIDDVSKASHAFGDFLMEEISMHKMKQNGKDEEEPGDFVAAYLKEIDRRKRSGEDMSYFSEWQLKCILVDLWIAGMDTTIATLRWAILALIKHPQIQQKVQQEIDNVLGRDKTPSMADRQSMPYIMAFINEVQRWRIIFPINLGHTNETDCYVGGYKIPKGIKVIPQVSVLAIDEKLFPDPSQFRPERFLAEDGKTLAKIEQFAPFSMGKRQCLGEGLARAELFLIFVHLMQQFEFAIVTGSEEPSDKPTLGVASAPQQYECLVKLR